VEPVDNGLLSTSYEAWHRASPPIDHDSLYYRPPVWDCYWFTPRDRDATNGVRRDEIIIVSDADKKSATNPSASENVLRLHATPAPKPDSLHNRFRNSWAGIMRAVPSAIDVDTVEYLSFFVKGEGGFSGKGNLYLQLGDLREDVSLNGGPPNGKSDREDTTSHRSNPSYSHHLDLGGDRLPDTAEHYLIPGSLAGSWDTLRYGDRLLGLDSLDPAKDNFREYYYSSGDLDNFRYACRQQADGTIDYSEDINGDGIVKVDGNERYFQFEIDLADSLSALIDTAVAYTNPGVWRKYRIPLRTTAYRTDINAPDWSTIPILRIIWSNFDALQLSKEQQLVLYHMELSHN